MKKILKYLFKSMPIGAAALIPREHKFLSLQKQRDTWAMWAEVDPTHTPQPFILHQHLTGSEPPISSKHLLTDVDYPMFSLHLYQIHPLFPHDCDVCVFIGRTADNKRDMYSCKDNVVVRHGIEGADYCSSLSFVNQSETIRQAALTSIALGYLDPNKAYLGYTGSKTLGEFIDGYQG